MNKLLKFFGGRYSNLKIFLLFLIVTSSVRFFIFIPTVIDHDESTYIIIADQLLSGKIPYVDNVEIKPLGIFLFFATALKLFGSNVFSIRLLTSIVISLTALFLFKAKRKVLEEKYALLVGFAYIIMTSLHKWTWAPNTEVYFNLFTAIGLFVVIDAKKTRQFLLLGLIMGLGFITKYMVIFDMAAFGLFFLFVEIPKAKLSLLFKNVLLMVVGFFSPLAIIAFAYKLMGYWDEFVFATFTISSNYASDHSLVRMISRFGEIFGGYFPLTLLYVGSIYFVLRSRKFDLPYKVLSIAWFIFVWIAIFLPGKLPLHYTLQALLPLCFFMFDFFKGDFKWINKIKPLYIYVVFFIMGIASLSMQYQKLVVKPDNAKEISNYLNEKLTEEDQIYVAARNIIYFLCNKDVPNKYVHTTLMIYPDHIRSFQVDVDKEFNHIKAINPRFIILEWRYASYIKKQLGDYLTLNYKVVKTWDSEKFVCYERD